MIPPTEFLIGNAITWVIDLRDGNDELVDADSTPTVAVRKNGASVGDSVTVTKRSSTTGIYDCSYNPAGEAEGDSYTLEISATIASSPRFESFTVIAKAAERGTDNAALQSLLSTVYALLQLTDSDVATILERADVATSTRSSHSASDVLTAMQANADDFKADVSGLATASALGTVATNVTTLLGRVTTSAAQMFADLIQMITGSGGANAQFTTKALALAPSGGGGGGGDGMYNVTIPLVDNLGNPVPGARVWINTSATSATPAIYEEFTNGSGNATFQLDAGTYYVRFSLTGYNPNADKLTLVVTGEETFTLT